MNHRICVFTVALLLSLMIIPSVKAQNSSSPIIYDQPVEGEFASGTRNVSYVLDAKQDDIVDVYVHTTGTDTSNPLYLKLTIRDSNNSIINTAPKTSGGSASSTNDGVIYINTFVFAVPKDGTYTLVFDQQRLGGVGKYKITAYKATPLEFNQPVSQTLPAHEFSELKHGGFYFIKSDTDFTVNFKQTHGGTNVTAAVSKLDGSTDLHIVGVIGGYSADPFGAVANQAFVGGSVTIKGNNQPYVITIGNNLSGFDERISSEDDSQVSYELSAYLLSNNAQNSAPTATGAEPPKPTPVPTQAATTEQSNKSANVSGKWDTLAFLGCDKNGFKVSGGSILVQKTVKMSYSWTDGTGQEHKSGDGEMTPQNYGGYELSFGFKPVKNPITVIVVIDGIEVAHLTGNSPCVSNK